MNFVRNILFKLMRAVFVLTAFAALVAWFGLVLLGVETSHSWLAVVALLVLVFSDGFMGAVAAGGFAVWGAYAGLKLHWFLALMLGIPVAQALVLGLLGLLTELLRPRFEKTAP